jgi:haloacid dehalogenase-like hydrolase
MPEKIIAILWDFDKTLITGYMQAPLFEHYGVDAIRFWDEVNALPKFHAGEGEGEPFISDSLYLNHILTYVREGVFAGLNNAVLRRLGATQRLAPGVPAIFEDIAQFARHHEAFQGGAIRIEHYVISTGLRQIVLGSAVAPYMRHVWACEFLERVAPPGFLAGTAEQQRGDTICDIGYVIDHTSKTRAIFEINKGVRENLGVNVNTKIAKAQRRIPFENMIYIADGPSDIPSLSVIDQFGGKAFGVYAPDSPRDFTQARQMLEQGRVHGIGPADYRQGSDTFSWLLQTIAETAERLARSPTVAAASAPIAPTPGHIYK